MACMERDRRGESNTMKAVRIFLCITICLCVAAGFAGGQTLPEQPLDLEPSGMSFDFLGGGTYDVTVLIHASYVDTISTPVAGCELFVNGTPAGVRFFGIDWRQLCPCMQQLDHPYCKESCSPLKGDCFLFALGGHSACACLVTKSCTYSDIAIPLGALVTAVVDGDSNVAEWNETNNQLDTLFQDCSREGDPGLYIDFGDTLRDVTAGNTFCWTVAPCNFGFVSGTCPDTDTFCVHMISKTGWTITGDPPLGACTELDPGYFLWQDVCITIPCDVEPGERDTLIIQMTYCDDALACRVDCADCEDPNWYGGSPYYSIDTVVVQVVPSPPALYILQDSLYYVAQGQSGAYIPFTVCNGDPCAGSFVYEYDIHSTGHVGGGFPQSGATDSIPGGDCEDVYAIVNASVAAVCTFDTLTIIAWDQASGTVYDTCVQIIHVLDGG